MFELLFLLLPIAAAYGYYMGRNSYKDRHASKKTEQTQNYLRGVNFLLNNKKEQAMDEFIAYLDSANPTFESSLALGNLFRQRGEVGKAISLHTSLANNEHTEPYENELAQIELACDFMSAGLLDRAEAILLDLVEIPRQRKNAAELLVKLYEQERDYIKAIDIGLNNQDVLSKSYLCNLSMYYCELAQKTMLDNNHKEALKLLEHAIDIYPESIRARLMKAEILIKEHKLGYQKKVLELASEIASLDRATGPFCLDLIERCFEGHANAHYKQALEELTAKTKSAAVIIALSKYIESHESHDQAQDLLLGYIKERPNIKLFSCYMGMRSKEPNQEGQSETIMQLKSIVDAQIALHSSYSCSNCGFESSMMFWQCPSCRHFDTMRIKHSIDGD